MLKLAAQMESGCYIGSCFSDPVMGSNWHLSQGSLPLEADSELAPPDVSISDEAAIHPGARTEACPLSPAGHAKLRRLGSSLGSCADADCAAIVRENLGRKT